MVVMEERHDVFAIFDEIKHFFKWIADRISRLDIARLLSLSRSEYVFDE